MFGREACLFTACSSTHEVILHLEMIAPNVCEQSFYSRFFANQRDVFGIRDPPANALARQEMRNSRKNSGAEGDRTVDCGEQQDSTRAVAATLRIQQVGCDPAIWGKRYRSR